MKPVRDIINREIIDDLWGAGYTILPRNRHPDPFFVQPEIIPQGRAYQWMHLIHDKFHIGDKDHSMGWAAVPASRHDGYFMPAGFVGDIEVNGLGLFEKPKFEVDADKAAQTAAAHKQVDDWIEDTTKIPRDMVPYIAQIFEERDRLAKHHLDDVELERGAIGKAFRLVMNANPSAEKWPTLHAILLPLAIENIRKRITEEASHGN